MFIHTDTIINPCSSIVFLDIVNASYPKMKNKCLHTPCRSIHNSLYHLKRQICTGELSCWQGRYYQTNKAMIVNQPSECYIYPTISSEKNATITHETKKANYYNRLRLFMIYLNIVFFLTRNESELLID